MDVQPRPETPEVLQATYRLFRDYFDMAERRRRWSIKDDIPWQQCNRSLPPHLSDVVETFCAVELYLPDYLSKLIPQVRAHRGRAWFLANWGYEESKHSMALEDWLLHSRMRSDEQVADFHNEVFSHEWDLPYDSAIGMLAYTVFQELATRIHYVRLAECVRREGGCPALEKVLHLVGIDEAAHADFFRRMVQVYLEHDRPGTVEQLRRVVNTFRMPSVHMLSGSSQRIAAVKKLRIFDEDIFVEQVFWPILNKLGLTPRDLRRKAAREQVVPLAGVNVKP